jgi:hypothetical protein
MAKRIAIGFRVHTGWAAGVALAGPATAPKVIDRRRVALAEETDTEKLQAFHLAAEQPFAKAEWMIGAARTATAKATQASLAAWLDELGTVERAGIVAGNAALPASLETILASHALIHAAEGEMFRAAIVEACAARDLHVVPFAGKTLTETGASLLGLTVGALRERLTAWGRDLGPPWGQDQKEAALVAWLALARRVR